MKNQEADICIHGIKKDQECPDCPLTCQRCGLEPYIEELKICFSCTTIPGVIKPEEDDDSPAVRPKRHQLIFMLRGVRQSLRDLLPDQRDVPDAWRNTAKSLIYEINDLLDDQDGACMSPNHRGDRKNVQDLWICVKCNKRSCSTCEGATDELPDYCDDCWALISKRELPVGNC